MHTDWSLFFGRFHPLLVHIPIGIIVFAALLSVVAVYKKSPVLESAINIALLAGGISAVFAALTGYFLSSSGGYSAQTLNWHKWIGIAAAALILITWYVRRNKKTNIVLAKTPLSNWLLIICIVLITAGGHLGGNMTHGEGYLTAHMPEFLRSVFGKKIIAEEKPLPPLDSVVVFRDIIQPVLQQKCIDCHNKDKTEGELDLSTIEGISKGGKSGNTIVAGDLEKSELFKRITLPRHSRKFMPADNRPPLSPIEISFMRWWILSGADYQKNITGQSVDDKMKYLVANYLGINAEDNKEIVLPEVPPADPATVQQLKDQKLLIRNLTSNSNLLDISFTMVQNTGADHIEQLMQKLSLVKDQVYRLDISNCGINKATLKTIGSFSRLNTLELQKNNIDDQCVELLQDLKKLELLNLGQNPLTDKCITSLKKLSGLKKINLWQTQVTEEGAKALQSQLQGVILEH